MTTSASFAVRLGSAAVAATLLLAPCAHATELAWREVSHLYESHPAALPESGGYTLGSGRGSGLAFFPNDEVATVTLTFTIDYLHGDGAFIAYETYQFKDGSAFSLKRRGRTASTKDGSGATFDGDFDLFNGKGRYANAHGKGSFTGARLAPLSAGADQYFDFKASYQQP